MKLVDYFVIVGYDEESDDEKNSDLDDGDDCDVENEIKFRKNQKKVNSIGKARIIQRFPLPCQNRRDSSSKKQRQSSGDEKTNEYGGDEQQEFDENIHCFCQPHKGWRLYAKQEAPTFFVSVLTDIKGRKCAFTLQ